MGEKTSTNPLGMKSIKETMNMSYGELVGDLATRIFKWDWIFDKWYEKIIVLGSIIFTIISIVGWII